MAGKKAGNGRGDLTIRVLEKIQKTLVGLRDDVAGLRQELRDLTERVDGLETATVRGFEAVTARLENIRDFAGEQHRAHDRRIASLEERLDRLEQRSGH